jgi:hypothetical protein
MLFDSTYRHLNRDNRFCQEVWAAQERGVMGPRGTEEHAVSPQDIHDDPELFEEYSRLPRSVSGLCAVYEWPAFQRRLSQDELCVEQRRPPFC